jgi:hypothetical protein
VAHARTLTESQVAVLQWIADGCSAKEMSGANPRVSAAALRRRGLVVTSGRGATWSARLTKAGRDYLRRVRGPSPPNPRQGNVSVAAQLVDEVMAAGGSLLVPRGSHVNAETNAYERRARLANHHRKVPPGTQLEIRRTREHIEIVLVDTPVPPLPAAPPSIRVPERVTKLHPAARAFRDDRDCHRVSRQQLARAVRILHAVAQEAERRRWAPSTPERTHDDGRPIAPIHRRDQLVLEVSDATFSVRLHERGVHCRGWWVVEKKREHPLGDLLGRRADPRLAGSSYDADASGVLTLELVSDDHGVLFTGRQSRWSDGQRQRLEQRLPLLFREIDERVVAAKQHAHIRQRTAERAHRLEQERREQVTRQWQALMAAAESAWREAMYASELRRQLDAKARAHEVREYCNAAETAHAHDPVTREWLQWARNYATRVDPLHQPPTAPQLPEPTPADLQPYLPSGWSALGPPEVSRTGLH